MTSDQFRRMLTAQPFQPFTLHLADGRELHVPHREFAGISPSGRIANVFLPDDSFELIDLLLVVGIESRGSATGAA